jgi:hypothetical protein
MLVRHKHSSQSRRSIKDRLKSFITRAPEDNLSVVGTRCQDGPESGMGPGHLVNKIIKLLKCFQAGQVCHKKPAKPSAKIPFRVCQNISFISEMREHKNSAESERPSSKNLFKIYHQISLKVLLKVGINFGVARNCACTLPSIYCSGKLRVKGTQGLKKGVVD